MQLINGARFSRRKVPGNAGKRWAQNLLTLRTASESGKQGQIHGYLRSESGRAERTYRGAGHRTKQTTRIYIYIYIYNINEGVTQGRVGGALGRGVTASAYGAQRPPRTLRQDRKRPTSLEANARNQNPHSRWLIWGALDEFCGVVVSACVGGSFGALIPRVLPTPVFLVCLILIALFLLVL